MQALQRITTEYDEHEDRLRLSGELSDGSSVLLWLTQRLLYRILPHLTQWLGQHDAGAAGNAVGLWQDSDWIQGFAQQAASRFVIRSRERRGSSARRRAGGQRRRGRVYDSGRLLRITA